MMMGLLFFCTVWGEIFADFLQVPHCSDCACSDCHCDDSVIVPVFWESKSFDFQKVGLLDVPATAGGNVLEYAFLYSFELIMSVFHPPNQSLLGMSG